mmetsp:Transcript_15984/g.37871  ORF Transcript_15984/g.37871 Transcript_15984/m.37871 type:complete len:255 (-) Transcript_15984:34-798(-)
MRTYGQCIPVHQAAPVDENVGAAVVGRDKAHATTLDPSLHHAGLPVGDHRRGGPPGRPGGAGHAFATHWHGSSVHRLGYGFVLAVVPAGLEHHLRPYDKGVSVRQTTPVHEKVCAPVRRGNEAHPSLLHPGLHNTWLSIHTCRWRKGCRLGGPSLVQADSTRALCCNGLVLRVVPTRLEEDLSANDQGVAIHKVAPMDKNIRAPVRWGDETHPSLFDPSLDCSWLARTLLASHGTKTPFEAPKAPLAVMWNKEM